MAKAARKAEQDANLVPAAPARPAPVAVSPEDARRGVASPAVELQQLVADAFAEDEPRWSPRRTLVFIGGTCGLFWVAVGLGVHALLN